jgi:hypothetical protein
MGQYKPVPDDAPLSTLEHADDEEENVTGDSLNSLLRSRVLMLLVGFFILWGSLFASRWLASVPVAAAKSADVLHEPQSTAQYPLLNSSDTGWGSGWPFQEIAQGSIAGQWTQLLAALYGTSTDSVVSNEAAFIAGHAVGSLFDLLDLASGTPGPELALCERSPAEDELDRDVSHLHLHISSGPHNGARRAQLDRQLRRAGFFNWTYHSRWTAEELHRNRPLVARWMRWPVDNNATFNYQQLNYLEHMSMLSAIATTDPSGLGVIMEDDAVVAPFFKQRMAWVASAVPATFTTVFFGGCLNIHRGVEELAADSTAALTDPCHRFVLPPGSVSCGACHAPRPSPLLIPHASSRCASGYLLSKDSASRIMALVERVVAAQDRFLPFDHQLNRVFELQMQDLQGVTDVPSVYYLEPPILFESAKILKANHLLI